MPRERFMGADCARNGATVGGRSGGGDEAAGDAMAGRSRSSHFRSRAPSRVVIACATAQRQHAAPYTAVHASARTPPKRRRALRCHLEHSRRPSAAFAAPAGVSCLCAAPSWRLRHRAYAFVRPDAALSGHCAAVGGQHDASALSTASGCPCRLHRPLSMLARAGLDDGFTVGGGCAARGFVRQLLQLAV